jgi:hypothetical protein
MLFGPTLPSAFAQAESLADWPAKAKAGGFAEQKAQRSPFSGLAEAMRTGQWADATNDPQEFADYYQKQIFPWITHSDKRGQREDVVIKLHNDFGRLAKFPDSPVRDKLIDITLESMAPIAKDGKEHPAARESALLAIGEVKSPKAVPVLMEIIRGKDMNQMLKVVAMADLVQLAEQRVLAADPAAADSVVKLMAMAAPIKKPNDGWRWMRGQAADILGALGSSANKAPDALLAVMADDDLPLIIRGKAARALGKLKYEGNLPDAKVYVQTFAQYGSDALADNLPGESRRIWAVCEDFLKGLDPLMTKGTPSKSAHDIHDAMDELKRTAAKPKAAAAGEDKPQYPSEEDLKPAIAKARKVLEAAAKK